MLPGLAGRRTIGSAVATARLAVAGNGDAAPAGWPCWPAALGGHHVREGDGTAMACLVHGAHAKVWSLASPPVLRVAARRGAVGGPLRPLRHLPDLGARPPRAGIPGSDPRTGPRLALAGAVPQPPAPGPGYLR